MKLNKNSKIILERFLKKDEKLRVIEKPEDLLKRVAKDCAAVEKKFNSNEEEIANIEKTFFNSMNNQEFLPNLPMLANAGRELQQLAACFVLPVEDSIDGIFKAVKEMAIIQKSGGGTGFDFSRLRPEGFSVRETGGVASGPVSFMKVFDSATAAIKEGGIRRGANMGILRIDHPDIEKFIQAKSSEQLTNFNISVAITEKFMEAVIKNKDFNLIFNNIPCKTIKARYLFDLISKNAWQTGDPGIIFIDEINNKNTLPELGRIEAANPCSEMPLLPYESCVLGSINLTKFLKKNKKINFEKLKETIHMAVRFLDNSIEASVYPLKDIERIVKANRKIGLGIMGFADLLIMMSIPYDSPRALQQAEKIMRFFKEETRSASQSLAEKRGSFSNISKSIFKDIKMRNSTLTTIAPTGTISIFADCSAGIEPLFNVIFKRNSSYGEMREEDFLFKEIEKKFKLKKSELEQIYSQGLKNSRLPLKIKKIFKTAHDISPEWHVKIQSAFQKYTDNAVSKTVNLPENSTIDDIKNIFILAYRLKCKGLTVYRYNSKAKQPLEFCGKCDK